MKMPWIFKGDSSSCKKVCADSVLWMFASASGLNKRSYMQDRIRENKSDMKKAFTTPLPSLWQMFGCENASAITALSQRAGQKDPLGNIEKADTDAKKISLLGDYFVTGGTETNKKTDNKVTIVGAGQVGMASAFSLITQLVTTNVTLVANVANRVMGEVLDLSRGSVFVSTGMEVHGTTKYEDTRESQVCVVSAGVRTIADESPHQHLQRNVELFKAIIPRLVQFSPNATLIIVSNPVDVMTYVAWRQSGLAANRVIGLGTSLDSAQFRFLLAQRLGLAPSSVHGWVIGKQGSSSIPVWSGVIAAGRRLRDLNPDVGTEKDTENWAELHKQVIQNAEDVIKLKGYTSWAVGMGVSAITRSVLANTRAVFPVSTLVQGRHGVQKEVFLSLPCVMNKNGVQNVVNQALTEKEVELFNQSAENMYESQKDLEL